MSVPETMAVIEMSEAGGPEVLVPGRRDVPSPAANEILVNVTAAGVNGPDLMQRKGLYPAPKGASDLLGLEIAGEVLAVGEDVSRWAVGDAVCGLTNGGGYAAYCVLDEQHALPVPAGLSALQAASLPETYFTIWSNVFMGAGLSAGETFLVHGGAGGLGSTSIQLGKAFGATVATTATGDGLAFCQGLGADMVIDFTTEDFVTSVREQLGGADVILDIIGGPYIEKNIKTAKHDGRIVQLAFAQGSKVEVNLMPVMLKRLSYTGSTLRSRSPESKAEIAAQLAAQVWPLFEAGNIKPVVNAEFPLDQAADAHRLMESGTHAGKIMLTL